MIAVIWRLVLLLWAPGVLAADNIGLPSPLRTEYLAKTDWAGNLDIYSVYRPENDFPDQYKALQTIYVALGGDHWSAVFKQTSYARTIEALVNGSATDSVTPVNFSTFASLFVLKVPWFTPGYSYCRWWGVTCCLTASESVLPTCTQGFQSVGMLTLQGANLTGVLPPIMWSGLPDLAIVFMGSNPGLSGQVADVSYPITANLLILQIPGTSLQNNCAEPVSGGKGSVYNSSCFSNLFLPDTNTTTTAVDRPGLVCPTLHIQRPSNQSNLTTAFFHHFVETDPLLYSFANCSCAAPLEAHYHRDTAGLFQMECVLPDNSANLWAIVASFTTLGFVVLVTLALYLIYRKRIVGEWDTMRINGLKRRHAPGTLMERQGKGMDLFRAGISIVMTDVEASTSLWEWNSRTMNAALALHDHTLRSLLPKYFGYEVTTEGDAFIVAFHDPIDAIGWALHVQLALLEAPWPPELLQHHKARVETCPDGKLLFRGLRVRVAINTGIPAEIIVHNVTKQVEYRGEMMELTEALSHLPAGGQVLLSDTTSRHTAGRLHHIHLPAFTFQCSRSSLEGASRASMEGLRSVYTKQLVTASSPSAQSTDGLLNAAATPTSAMQDGGLAQTKRSSWFSLQHVGTPTSIPALVPASRRQSLDAAHIDVASDEQQQSHHFAVSTFFTRRFARSSSLTGPLESTALASLSHSACIIIDMGNFVLSECRNRAYTAEDAALPCIAGEHVRQILPEALVERAALLPGLDPARQVAPSFFDAPGAQAAGKMTPRQKMGGLNMPSSFSSQSTPLCNVSTAALQRLPQDLPDITFAFVSESGYKEVASMDKQVAMIALGRFKSCVRTSLLLHDGYECQENEGTFIVAFVCPRAALEWALTLQLALLKVPWGEALLSMASAKEQHDSATGQVLLRGLSAKVGISSGPIARLCPHAVTGRADYVGAAVGRAARLWPVCNAGQILVEQSLLTAVGLEWTGLQCTEALPAAPASHLALRNHALLVHRAEVDAAAAELTCSTTSLSGIIGKQLTLGRAASTMSRFSHSLPRSPSGPSGLQSGDSIPVAMPGSERRRSMTMGHTKRQALSHATSRFQDALAPRDTRDFDDWWSRASGTPLSSPRGPSPKATHMHDNEEFRRTDSTADGTEDTDSKVAMKDAAEATNCPKGISTRIPSVPVQVEAYHMGLYTFRGAPEKVSLCQVFPASLSGRRCADGDVDLHGWKALGPRRDGSLALSAEVMLLDVLRLPLSAEPPLCINMVMPESRGGKQHVSSCFR